MSRVELDLGEGAWLQILVQWLDPAECESLTASLLGELEWHQHRIRLFGRMVDEPRRIAWAGQLPYRYSGVTLAAREMPRVLHALLDRVSGTARAPFNHVLLNHYRSETDGMGYHADDEPELGQCPVIATLSLGASRPFLFRPKRRSAEGRSAERRRSERVVLDSGTLLVMGGTFQERFQHAVPKLSRATSSRISVTCRHLLCAPQGG